jgi:D-alanine--poly(phosphoribitol) ligase subunit 1
VESAQAAPAHEPGSDGGDAVELILRHARQRPHAPAVKDDDEALSYTQLSERVVSFASGLRAAGVVAGDRVALQLGNSAAFVVAALGCLWMGAAFVPLSQDDPPARTARILEDSQPALVVGPDPSNAILIGQRKGRVTCTVESILRSAGAPPVRSEDRERDAYLIYTSGTTGAPKGVRTPEPAFHWAIVNAAALVGLGPASRTLCVSPFHFDGSYGTAFPTLAAGGAIVIPKREELLYLSRFFRAVLEERITHTGFSPSYLRLLVNSPRLGGLARSRLKTLGLGGEQCIAPDIERLWRVLPQLRIFNRYGPTETTIEVTTSEIDRRDVESGTIPIGTPHAGVTFHLIDRAGQIIRDRNETGELYIGGRQLMRGYWGDEGLTSQVLRQDVVRGETLYQTGDLVYRDAGGRFVYVGRANDVVKRRGMRISLGEIAQALRRVDRVRAAHCLVVELDGRTAITAFVEVAPEVTEQAVLRAVSAELPESMLPDQLFIVSSIPMTPSGKVDRLGLLDEARRERVPVGPVRIGRAR